MKTDRHIDSCCCCCQLESWLWILTFIRQNLTSSSVKVKIAQGGVTITLGC